MIEVHDRLRPQARPQLFAGHQRSGFLQQRCEQQKGLLLQGQELAEFRQLPRGEIGLENAEPQTSG